MDIKTRYKKLHWLSSANEGLVPSLVRIIYTQEGLESLKLSAISELATYILILSINLYYSAWKPIGSQSADISD